MKLKFAFIAFVLLLTVTQTAYSCSRCGLFGNRCRYYYPQKVVVAQAVPVIQQKQADVFVINNVYPQSILAAQGNTVYGLQAASAPYAVNPAELFRQAAEFSRASISSSQLAITGYNNLANVQLQLQSRLNEPLIRSQAAVQVLQAAGLNCQQPTQQQALSLRIYADTNGQWKVEQADTASISKANSPIQADNRLAPQQKSSLGGSPIQAPEGRSSQLPAEQSILAAKCYKCHSAHSSALKGKLYLDRAISGDTLREAILRIKSQEPDYKMPPDSSLTPGEAGQILDELLELSAPPASQLPSDVPPAPQAQPLQE